jgi:arylsulfatase A-like enzyme
MKRLIYVVLIVVMIACKNVDQNTETKKRPNIIFIMTDDHAYQAISAYDNRLTQTPNIDRLAAEGMIFNNACVTNSLCAPSRATILTGKHCHIHGKIDNDNTVFDTTQMTFPQIFQEAGYQTTMFGKLHFGNNPKGIDEFKILPDQGSYINPDFITNDGEITIEGYCTDIITDLSIDWLENRRDEDKPFLMFYLHKAPHRPWWPRPDKFKEYSQKEFPLPANLFDTYENRGTAAKTAEMNLLGHMTHSHDSKVWPDTVNSMDNVTPMQDEWGVDAFIEEYTERVNEEQHALYKTIIDSISSFFKQNWPGMTDEEKMIWKYQRYMQDYLASISSVDDNVGRLLDYLDANGLAENTIVVYTSDQGFFLGEHGWFDKRFIYNESFKTPLLVRWPGVVQPKSSSEEMVQNLDFAQTFLEAAGIEAPKDMQGESFVSLLKGDIDKWTREAVYYHYYEFPGAHAVKRHYGIVSKAFKLAHFYYDIDEWELYDRLNDPMEMKNVYNDPAYAEVVAEMKEKLAKMREQYKDSSENDQMFIEEYERQEAEWAAEEEEWEEEEEEEED